jgi:hypothetical protein
VMGLYDCLFSGLEGEVGGWGFRRRQRPSPHVMRHNTVQCRPACLALMALDPIRVQLCPLSNHLMGPAEPSWFAHLTS